MQQHQQLKTGPQNPKRDQRVEKILDLHPSDPRVRYQNVIASENIILLNSFLYVAIASESRDAPFIPTAKLSDLGGIDHCIEEIMELIAMPLAHPEVYLHTGVQPPRGVLLHGPPGCGKTRLAHAIAGELGVPFFNISAPSIVSGMSGESEKKIREVFEEARVSRNKVTSSLC